MAGALRKRFLRGLVRYNGAETVPFGARLHAKTSVCSDGVKKRNIHRLKAAVLNDIVNYPRLKAAVFRGASYRLQPVGVDFSGNKAGSGGGGISMREIP
jgi:predicted outer membrane repeat protein